MSNKVFIFHKIKKIFHKIQKIGIIEILNYFFINFKILYAFFFTLYNSKKIFYKKGNFLSFSEPNAISHTYYKIEHLNFTKFGNQGLSNIINFENYSLSNFWNISRLSVLIYSKYGCLVTLLGNFLFIFFHVIFISDSNPIWVSPIIFFLFIFSTTVYGSCFACQNYSPLAYLFFPLFIFCTINHFLIFSSIFLLFIAIFSFSFFIISILFIILFYNFSIISILSIFLPSIIYFIFFRFYSLIKNNNLFNSISKILRFTGFIKNSAYVREDVHFNNPCSFYFLTLYVFGILIFFISNNKFPILASIGLFIFITNQYLIRFSDFENIIVAFISLFVVDIIKSNHSFLSFISLFLVSNPLPFLVRVCSQKNFFNYNKIFIFKAINSYYLENKILKLFNNIKGEKRIYFVFKPPVNNLRNNLFNGYSYIIDFPTYVANKNGIMVFPNTHTPFIYNKENDLDPWCNNLSFLKKKLLKFNCNYFLIFNDFNKAELLFLNKNFKLVNNFFFRDLKLNSYKYFYGDKIKINKLELLLFKWKRKS